MLEAIAEDKEYVEWVSVILPPGWLRRHLMVDYVLSINLHSLRFIGHRPTAIVRTFTFRD
jgi:hypothetical protein